MLYITLRPYGQRKGVYSSSQIRGGDHVNIRAEASEPARYLRQLGLRMSSAL